MKQKDKTHFQLSRVISYRMFSMFCFFLYFPEDWSQAVSDESSVGRKSNLIAVQSSWLFLLVRIYFFLYSKVLALSLEIKQAYDCIMLFTVGKTGMVCRPQMPLYAACVASVSSGVFARKLEREQKNKKVEGGEGGEKRKRLPANPTILENAPWYFTVRFICKLTARQNRIITNRLPLDHQIWKITFHSRVFMTYIRLGTPYGDLICVCVTIHLRFFVICNLRLCTNVVNASLPVVTLECPVLGRVVDKWSRITRSSGYLACVASVSVWFRSKERPRNGILGFGRARNVGKLVSQPLVCLR